jgi:Domain of unknown function (DUF5667)
VRMHRPKPNKLHDELDALLDRRPVELTDELVPLAEVADALRAELSALELDPEVAERHLEQVLDDSATVVRLPVRPAPTGWELRRRVAAVVLAAALVLAPATMASAAALPGQAMYPFKLAIEQLRIVSVQWSPSREAVERTRVANERLEEVQQLVELKMFTQLPTAIKALTKAVVQAQKAVADAREDGEPVDQKVEQQLSRVAASGRQAVDQAVAAAQAASVPVPRDTLKEIQAAAGKAKTMLPPTEPQAAPSGAPSGATPTPTTVTTRPDPGTESTSGSATTQPLPASSTPETTTQTSTSSTTTNPPTTTAPPTTTTSTTSEPEATTGSLADQPGTAADLASPQAVTPTTVQATGP